MKTIMIALLSCLLLSACTSTSDSEQINKIAIGMTKSEVIAAMGTPEHSKGRGREEFLIYSLYTDQEKAECAGIGVFTLGMLTKYCGTEYFVHLKDGKVFSYGKTGDYGISTEELARPFE